MSWIGSAASWPRCGSSTTRASTPSRRGSRRLEGRPAPEAAQASQQAVAPDRAQAPEQAATPAVPSASASQPPRVEVPAGATGVGGPEGALPVYGSTSALSKIFNPDVAVIGNFLGAAG